MDAQYCRRHLVQVLYRVRLQPALRHRFLGRVRQRNRRLDFPQRTVSGGQIPPAVPCNRSQFAQPWPGSSNPSFSGWHHIAWTFLRNLDGTVTYQTLTFDGSTTQVNFHPNSASGGKVSDSGNFSALIQLDGVVNYSLQHNLVEAYVSEINLSHTP